MNPMRAVRIDKVTLNIGIGEPGPRLEKAMKLLQTITSATPVSVKTMKRIPTWGVRPKLRIATKVTLRGKKAEAILDRLLSACDKKIPLSKFDAFGNFSFGIAEYLDIPGVKYDVDIGIIGLEVAVTLVRAGSCVRLRRIKPVRIPLRHRVHREEAVAFISEKFGVSVVDEREGAVA